MTTRIFSGLSEKINELSPKQFFVGCDPQTSGGLLIAIDPAAVSEFQKMAGQFNLKKVAEKPVGKMLSKREKLIEVRN